MPDFQYTGDPATDQAIYQQLVASIAQNSNMQRNQYMESLGSRGLLNSGQVQTGLSQIGQDQAQQGVHAALAAAAAHAERIRRQQEANADFERQKQLMAFQHGLNRPRKNSPWQNALLGGASGATVGASAGGPWGALIGGVAGAGLGYFAGDQGGTY